MPKKLKKKPITSKAKWGKTDKDLRLKTEEFCMLYTSPNREFFGNWVQSYIEAYEPDRLNPNRYKNACAAASQLLTNTKVIARINELLEDWGFNDVHVDKELSFLITQHIDFGTKLWAIREYNKLKKRVDDAMKPIVNIDKVQVIIDK